ncbi:MAG: NAD-dependent DNA ligase LigA [Lachnospiraceae bacterium]|nr:NAD-dependent DNA ligase LigA [Lachnospiraceae bacterium]
MESFPKRLETAEKTQDLKQRQRLLTDLLSEASKAYYSESIELMANHEYDRLYDELEALEKETGIALSNSPTQRVGYEVVSDLPKERHAFPMLSLGKTKDRAELRSWLSGHPAVLSWKLDGLTIVLTYQNGQLAKAVTRGNGEVGEVITNNAKVFANVPLNIPYQGELVLRGEAVITYKDFERVNKSLLEGEAPYKNPRNLCSGSVRQLDNRITKERNVRFVAFSLVSAENVNFEDSFSKQLQFLTDQGFTVVESHLVTEESLLACLEDFEKRAATYEIPSDGLVLTFEELSYGASLGRTAKFPRNAIAFKWADEEAKTTLRAMEWSASRTGLINPVAIFDPVELEGTTVKRASVHNISIVKELKLGIGDQITVYKANMIIPQIAENLTGSGSLEIPDKCPVCGGETGIVKENESEVLICKNPECPAKKLKLFALFTSRNAMDIEGLSEQTLEKFISKGFLHDFADIFRLPAHREEIVQMEGFGELSYKNLEASLERAKRTMLSRLLFGIGIPGIGQANARLISQRFKGEIEGVRNAAEEDFAGIEGIGPVLAKSLWAYFQDSKKRAALDDLLSEVTLEKEDCPGEDSPLAGKSIVITGSLAHFANRDELKALIERAGGKVAGSVSSKTAALINNDQASTTGKNKKAKELGIPILSEEEFLAQYGLSY